ALIGSVLALCLAGSSCNDELDLAPIDYPGAGSFWTNSTEFVGNIYSMSSMFRSNYTMNITFWAGELRAGTLTVDLINGSGALNEDYIQNLYDESHTQFSNFGNYYGFIANLNELIFECNRADEAILSDNIKNCLLGIAHGWRAFSYFQLYRMYGGVPLRQEPDVILGITNPEELYMPRATAQETLDFIKNDIQLSLGFFNNTNYTINSKKQYYWSKAATEMLAGEVYLWSGKVETDDHKANAADVTTAKTYFNNVVNNYGYKLVSNYFDVWSTPRNSEIIYSVCYSSLDDQVQSTGVSNQFLWSKSAGAGTVSWSIQDATGLGFVKDGSASRFGYYNGAQYSCWNLLTPSPNRYMYKNAMYFQIDDQDQRKEMYFPQWAVTDEEEGKNITYIENFDPTTHTMMGSFMNKYRPTIVSEWSQSYIWNNDIAIYRLPLAYMYLAEIANYEGNNADVVKYINLVRQRAYGSNWDVAKYGYTAGSFRENENAILREKDKEFLMEGQRWWDLRRLTAVKGGSQTDHFVFQPESCAGYGLNTAANPWMVDASGQAVQTSVPVLNTSEVHKLLWPIDATLLGSDPEIKQNPGY
ncbi:MAG: RagB/SusD family nutrient uptake outer membrane protein, partial [Paramuribaculum sp.]|nr:RagB/SusD family nutrient uptake outer membrane protein [Paramuribaculum sp.]